ncbi:MAG: BlaI/MecI/CopY family transcriptional regulator [Pseudohongiellaceae bacterium]
MTVRRSSSNTLSGSTLGERELRVMEILWKTPHLDARDVTSRLTGRRPSLSTVQSTLERLYRKGLVDREKRGSAYHYFALVSRSSLLARLMGDVIHLLHDGRMETILSSFVTVAADMDEHSLDELEQLIAHRRRQEEQGDG